MKYDVKMLLAAGLTLVLCVQKIDAQAMTLTQNCTQIPGTSTGVGAACIARSSFPALHNPQNPISYGADPTGAEDSTTAFQNAVNIGDVYVSQAGTYLINLPTGHGIIPPAGRNIECAPGVTLKTTLHGGHDTGILHLASDNVTVAGCDFQGSNTGSGAKALDYDQGNFLIMVSGSSNTLIEGNTFENTWANSAIQFNTDYTGLASTNSTVQYNTFSGNPYYGPEVDNGNGITIQNNLSIDSPIGVEDVKCATEASWTGVLIQNNMLQVSVGDCRATGDTDCDGTVFITGGSSPSGCNYSSDTVRNNYCVGNSIQHAGIENTAPSSGSAASYSGNILGSDCVCTSGAGSC
jgi:hypothetical protein